MSDKTREHLEQALTTPATPDADERAALDAAYARFSPLAEGWQAVPVEPTEEMWQAAHQFNYGFVGQVDRWRGVYRAMLKAAPSPPMQPVAWRWRETTNGFGPSSWHVVVERPSFTPYDLSRVECEPLYASPPIEARRAVIEECAKIVDAARERNEASASAFRARPARDRRDEEDYERMARNFDTAAATLAEASTTIRALEQQHAD